MRYILIIVLLMFPVAAQAQEQVFFDSLYDVPVMAGLTELPDMALSFDKPDGRISQAGAVINGQSRTAVADFYDQTLAQLGWKRVHEGGYEREAETLTISFEHADKAKIVKFLLEPAKKP